MQMCGPRFDSELVEQADIKHFWANHGNVNEDKLRYVIMEKNLNLEKYTKIFM